MWNDGDRAKLDAVLDHLIPPNPAKGIPAAGKLGVAEFLAIRAQENVRLRTQIATLLDRVADLAEPVSHARVRQLESEEPEAFAALLQQTYMGYYSRADTRPHFGVAAHPVHPRGYDVAPESPELMAELTTPVRTRGAIYRDV